MPALRRRLARLRATLLVLAIVSIVAGCGGSLASLLPGNSPLVTVKLEGGMCPQDLCKSEWVLQRDGRVLTVADPPEEVGRAGAQAMTALVAAVQATDYAAIKARPFRGECPTAFDGQELVIEFHAPSGSQVIRSCETEIDWSHPLFVATAAALAPLIPLPTES